MDIEKLIDQLKGIANGLAEDEFQKCANAVRQAATTLSTLQAENSQLRESRDHWKRLAHELSEGVNGKDAEHERLQAENEKLRAELEQVKRGNDALWTYIEIVDREYRRYMDRGYIDRLDELKRTWRRGQKED